jgi:hypothetical protein
MPRLTNNRYLEVQHWLANAWRVDQRVFALVSPTEQWTLHDFFVPSWSLTDDELLGYRAKITSEQASLPQRAGRAFAQLDRAFAEFQANLPVPVSSKSVGKRRVVVHAVVRPSIDTDAMVRALTQLAQKLDAESGQDRPAA